MTPSVRASLQDLRAGHFDLLVIGGGITGAGIAREAAQRGCKTALVEARDIGWGTSSRSSRLIHGGLRYLEQGRLRLVFEALAERRVMLRLAPHLVHALPFLLPTYRGDRVPRWKVSAGLALYDLLAAGGNVRRHRTLGKRGLLEAEPLIRERGLTGGALYYDAQCDDARLTLAVARAAQMEGAQVASYTRVTGLIRSVSGIAGAYLQDEITGESGETRARLVINATGPWSDALRRMEDPRAEPLLRPTKGVHVVVPRRRIGHSHALIFTSALDGRVMFILPWGEWSYIGTTDTDSAETPDAVEATADEVIYLLRSANALFPQARLQPEDVIATWAGLRPLLATDPSLPTSRVSREHRLVRGPQGMLSIAGGKLTTWRRMASDTVDAAQRILWGHRRSAGRSLSASRPLPGGETAAIEPFRAEGLALGLGAASVDHLLRLYGTEAPAVFSLCRERPELAAPIHPEHPAVGAAVIHSIRREMAQRVDDVLCRRLRLSTETSDRGAAAIEPLANLMAQELGWEGGRWRDEVALAARASALDAPWRALS